MLFAVIHIKARVSICKIMNFKFKQMPTNIILQINGLFIIFSAICTFN